VAHWISGSSDIALSTQVVNPNLINAIVPAALLTTPQVAQIRVVQPSGAASNSLPFSVIGTLTITTSSLPNGTVGEPYSGAVVAAETVGAVNWISQNLPAGLQLNAATGAITGTPAGFGTTIVTFTVIDSLLRSATRNIPLTINPGALSITTASLPSGTSNAPYSATVAASGGAPPYSWTAQGLPSGLSIGSSTGLIGGTTASFGSFPVTIGVTDGSRTASRGYTLVIGPPALSITTTALPAGTRGVLYSAALAASGGVAPLVWNAQGLPNGLTLNTSTGAIAGTPTAAGTSPVNVTVTDAASQTANRTFSLVIAQPPLSIVTTGLPGGRQSVPYNAAVAATGGNPPLSWSATQLPPGVVLNSSTGALSGIPTATGTFPSRFTVTDSSQQSVSATLPIVIDEPPIPTLDIIGPGTLPPGTVNVPYTAGLQITGGRPGYTAVVVAGSLPAGLSLIPEGAIGGIPTTPGTSRFSVRVTDSAGATAFKDYVLPINPAPLTVTGAVQNVPRDSAINVRFGATGGVPPYQFSATGAIPTGTTFVNGLLSGTANASGSFTFNVAATDSAGVSANRSFTIVVGPPSLSVSGIAPNGQVNVNYSAGFFGTGGTGPYTYSATGLPPGLTAAVIPGTLQTVSSFGVSGVPTTAGTFPLVITVKDSTGAEASQTFSVVIAPAQLQITTASLPAGTLGSAYTASLAASGGVPPYSFAVAGLPSPLSATPAGVISGTPGAAAVFNLNVTVTDSKGATVSRSLTLTIAPPPLTILTGSVPSGTVGTAVSLTFQASGGVPPYTWSAAGLPLNLVLSGSGALSGSPANAGTTTFSVAVTDSTGASVNRQFSFTAGLPSVPTLNLTGLPATSNPASQSSLGIGISTAFPLPVTVDLTLTFAADVGADDPTVQFAGGGRTARVTIPAGSTAALNNLGVQLGTVAGTATITARLSAGGQDLTPTPVPTRTVRINGGPPVIASVTATRSASGLTVTITGFATTRSVSTANFTFTPAAGSTLQTTQLSVTVDGIFSAFFQSAAGAATGSQFTFTQPFTTSGTGTVASLAVTLGNAAGTSNSMSANVQ
jgi:large repetitive protein